MRGIIRKRTSMLLWSAMLLLGGNVEIQVSAFGVPNMMATEMQIRTTMESVTSLNMHKENHRKPRELRQTSIARKAALVDSSSVNRSRGRIRSRVESFLRSKKKFQSNKVVQEVSDIDAIKRLLGEAQSTAAYTAVIFHAPYCKACKASMPLFENLAKQYNRNSKLLQRKRRKQERSGSTSPWLSSSLSEEEASAKESVPKKDTPSVRFLSVPVTQDNASQLQDNFGVTKFPLAHIYDPIEGLVDERPVLRKLFSGFEERLASVVDEQ